MSKESLNLSVEPNLKQQAKKIAQKRGISISRLFEQMIASQKEVDVFTPPPGSGTAQFVNAIPESDKVDDYDYKKMKAEALEEKYGTE